MSSKVISISRSLASRGEEVARDVANQLAFRFVDDEIIARAAAKAGVSPGSMEKVERSPSLIDRILKHMGSASVEPGFGAYTPPSLTASDSYEGIIAGVIHETAAAGKVVILAHGASIPLAGMPGLLRVLITGSPAVRAARLAKADGVGDARAKKAVQDSDRERRDFLQRFYQVREELPIHYDLVINTDSILAPIAASLIVAAARG
ncbi:MAG: cytidylate kinase-like family protein [Chloroflexi bacterium]|nr:MAG: cytidylate kinase-like family protein [Chloroflexota bacterium]